MQLAITSDEDEILSGDARQKIMQDLWDRRGNTGTGDPTAFLSICQASVQFARSGELLDAISDAVAGLGALRFSKSTESVFPQPQVVCITRDDAVLSRGKMPTIWLRLEQDQELRAGKVQHLKRPAGSSMEIFASSRELSLGAYLLDAYLGPLVACLSPSIWAVPAYRSYAAIVLSLGRALAGSAGEAREGLHLIPTSPGSQERSPVPHVTPDACSNAVTWWASSLNGLFSVYSDPALFTDRDGVYVAAKHLQGLLTIEQLFRRSTSLLVEHRDGSARRVLLFTVLDTLERLTGHPLEQLCSLTHATQTIERLRSSLPEVTHPVLLHSAQRAIAALKNVQDGFFMAEEDKVTLRDRRGIVVQELTRERAAGQFIKVLRNATHGHGAKKPRDQARTSALLAHHTGALHHDLPLLGYLYLLDVLADPQRLRPAIHRAGD